MGNWDAVLRVFAGSVIMIAGIVFENWWGLLGLVLIITGSISWCPVYRILGIKTSEPNLEQEV